MIVFADTSALFSLLVHDDFMHLRARAKQSRLRCSLWAKEYNFWRNAA
jgi:hypothetical protein